MQTDYHMTVSMAEGLCARWQKRRGVLQLTAGFTEIFMAGPVRSDRVPVIPRLLGELICLVCAITIMVPMASAQERNAAPLACDASPEIRSPDIRSFSGNPLLLQLIVTNPSARLRELALRSESSTLSYRIPDDLDRDELVIHASPFFGPGIHDVEIRMECRDGSIRPASFQVGFIDFVWGRDNLSFANNDSYKSVIGTFAEILADWIVERFGRIDDADLVLLVDYMYGLFGTNTGRCYAFAGTEVRYWLWPDLLPARYRTAHDIRGSVARYQREMNYLQFDLVFEHFVARGGFDLLWRPMSRDAILAQALEIEARIAGGTPVAVGFGGPGFHHSMLVFGFIHNPARQTIDLLVANNWKSDEKLNIHSEDAEMVRLFLSPDHEGPRVEWRYEGGLRTSIIDRLITLDVRREPHLHDRAHLDELIVHLRERLAAENRVLVVVEEAAAARLIADGRMSGTVRNREVRQLDDVWFEDLRRIYRFSYPVGMQVELEIENDAGSLIYTVAPDPQTGARIAGISRMEAPPPGSRVTRRQTLPGHLPGAADTAAPQ